VWRVKKNVSGRVPTNQPQDGTVQASTPVEAFAAVEESIGAPAVQVGRAEAEERRAVSRLHCRGT
jgi:hypothetical protein